MIPTLFCYQVVLVGLVWLFFLLYWLRPTDSGIRGRTIVSVLPVSMRDIPLGSNLQ
jgi:hypothetical protein